MPEDLQDKAEHLLLTDHYFDRAQLQEFARAIKAGQSVQFPEELLQETLQAVAEGEETHRKLKYLFVALLAALLLFLAYRFLAG